MRHSGYPGFPTDNAECGMQCRLPMILTIDDDPNVSQALKRRFGRYAVTLLQAHHGTQGIWLATTKRPDLIITDLRMPQGRGQDVVAYLVRDPRTRRIPIIVLTGLFDNELKRRMLHLGVGGYFTKPVSFEDLCQTVRRFIDLRQRPEDTEEMMFHGPDGGVSCQFGEPQELASG
jgi:response regulator RpfG family c-di-GMP phosphodiesterase